MRAGQRHRVDAVVVDEGGDAELHCYPCLSASDNETTLTDRLFPYLANQLRQSVIRADLRHGVRRQEELLSSCPLDVFVECIGTEHAGE